MINIIKNKMDKLQKEMKKDYKYYLNKYQDVIDKGREDKIELAKKIKSKMDAQYFVEFNILRDKYNILLSEKEKNSILVKEEKLENKKKIEELFIKPQLEIDEDKINYICENDEFIKLTNCLNNKDFIVHRYSFTKENIHEYFYIEQNKIIATKAGKKILNILRSGFELKKTILLFLTQAGAYEQLDLYLIIKNKKMFKFIIIRYRDNRLFLNKLEKIKNNKDEICYLGGALLVQNEDRIDFITSITFECNDMQIKEEASKEFIEVIENLYKKNNLKNNIAKIKKQIKAKLKEVNPFQSIIVNAKNNNEMYFINYISEDTYQFLRIVQNTIENYFNVKNIITENTINFNSLEELESILNTGDILKKTFCNKKGKVKTIKPNIMIVGGNWSEVTKNEVLKDYDALFIPLEEYERYSEKSKNMDYIFIDTSANTHSNTYKAKSIHDNVRLISRSKKEEIDKWFE